MVERVLYSLPDHHNYGACHCQQNCLLWLKLCLVSVQGRSGQFIQIPRLINYTIDSWNTKKSLKCSPRQNQLHGKDAAFIRGQNFRQVKHVYIKKSKIYIYIFSLFDLKDEVSFLDHLWSVVYLSSPEPPGQFHQISHIAQGVTPVQVPTV